MFEMLLKDDGTSEKDSNMDYESIISGFIRRFREEKPTAPEERSRNVPQSPLLVLESILLQ